MAKPSIRKIIQTVLDNTDAADIGSQTQADALTDEICFFLKTNGYETGERDE